jgi:murein DD-endopeptidase MepM/ murein hydrolase activator NlpD
MLRRAWLSLAVSFVYVAVSTMLAYGEGLQIPLESENKEAEANQPPTSSGADPEAPIPEAPLPEAPLPEAPTQSAPPDAGGGPPGSPWEESRSDADGAPSEPPPDPLTGEPDESSAESPTPPPTTAYVEPPDPGSDGPEVAPTTTVVGEPEVPFSPPATTIDPHPEESFSPPATTMDPDPEENLPADDPLPFDPPPTGTTKPLEPQSPSKPKPADGTRSKPKPKAVSGVRSPQRAVAAKAPSRATRTVIEVACPIAARHSFSDTFGAPRGGGRAHKGTDLMAKHGATVYAYTGGEVMRTTVNRGLGGTTVWIRGTDGSTYYYAHLGDLFVRPGQRVQAGQPIGRNGSSGNASAKAPHLHFEVHPGGGRAVNSYPYLRQACG